MCGRYGFVPPRNEVELYERYELINKPKLVTTYNLAPTMKGLVIHKNSPKTGEYLPFGIEANWKPGMRLINAKSETVAELRTFSKMFREARCIIPASFFFEWKRDESGKKPYLIKVKDEKIFSFAGIYKPGEGFVILTTAPNSLMEKIHNRQPCILAKEDEERYLDEDATVDDLMTLIEGFPANHMDTYAVSPLVNRPSHQGEEIIKPLS